MSCFSDTPIVEVSDAFGEGDFVGPPPSSSAQADEVQSNNGPTTRLKQTRKSLLNESVLPNIAVAESSPVGGFGMSNSGEMTPVDYTPVHPSQMLQSSQPTPLRRATRRTRNEAISVDAGKSQYQPPRQRAAVARLQPAILQPRLPPYAAPAFIPPRLPTTQLPLYRPPVGHQSINTNPANSNNVITNQLPTSWSTQINPSRLGSAPNFTTFGNGTPQESPLDWRSHYLNRPNSLLYNNRPPIPAHSQVPLTNSAPLPNAPLAHNTACHVQAHSSRNPPRQRSSNVYNIRQMAPRMDFAPQAVPVRSAYEDFTRQLQSSAPGFDIDTPLNQVVNYPSQPVQIPLPNGADNATLQRKVHQELESALIQASAQMNIPFNGALHDPSTLKLIDELMFLFDGSKQQNQNQNQNQPQTQIQTQPVPGPPPVIKPPSEDDMAKQDVDADAHDEEYREVETYADYVPAKLTIGEQHPDPIVETSSLATVEPPDIDYEIKLPKSVIAKARLSALQLESVIYSCQQHKKLLADGRTRRGFLIGDGAGVGKGRTIAGIIYENYIWGRKKSIWLSVSTDLKLDAERDLKDIGAKIPVHLLGKFQYGKKINASEGVMFLTYSGLVSKSQSVKYLGTRLDQLIHWVGNNFDGVIVFDECHKAKNISMKKDKKAATKAAEYALQIQARLPKARVVYASATGASETKHLGYMTRLGIWGVGTPYEDFQDFCSAIEKRGVGAMELVAVDLKMRGSYIARQLSFKTTSFEIKIAHLDDKFTKLYDECVEMWAIAFRSFSEAASYLDDKKSTRTLWTTFWGAHQRFFKYLCIGAKVPLVIEIAKEALKNDKCVVIGLQSTGEAKALEALEEGEIDGFISTASATFESLVTKQFPAPLEGRRIRHQAVKSPTNSSVASAAPSTSGSSSSTVDESYHGHDAIKFVVENGFVTAQLEKEKLAKKSKLNSAKKQTRQLSKRELDLAELAEQKQNKAKLKSSRALRAKQRSLKKSGAKSRIKMPCEDSDTEISNPLSSCSSTGILTEDSIAEEEDSDSTFEDEESSSTEDDYAETIVGSDESELSAVVEAKRRRRQTSAGPSKKEVLDSESDSDIEITAIKPRPCVVFLGSSEDDAEEDEKHQNDPIVKHGPKLTALREELYRLIDNLGPRLPTNALDDLIDQLGGPSKVAELTGRKGRLVRDEDGSVSYKSRNMDEALENLNIAEKERFMKGQKLVAIISEAASSGISLQADKRCLNTKRRVHITIELPWSADRAIQQFGRTHRSNQVNGPQYVFVISELAGEKRFASIVAKRLESLGALTHGDRRATTESRDLSQFNILSKYSKQALELLFNYLQTGGTFASIQPVYYDERNFLRDAREAFLGAGIGGLKYGIFSVEPCALQINTFLNRLLGMKVAIQNALFTLFTDYMNRLIARKKVSGQYDAGILELNSESGKTRCSEPENFYLKTASEIVKCTLRNVQVERGVTWEEATKLLEDAQAACADSRSSFYLHTNPLSKAKMVFLLLREESAIDHFRIFKPNTGRQQKSEHYSIISEKGTKCCPSEAEALWRHIYKSTDSDCVHICLFNSCKRKEAKMKCDVGLRHRKYCILSGGILTAWPYLERKAPDVTTRLQIVRLKLDANNRVIGPIIPQDYVDRVMLLLKRGEQGVEF